MMKTIVLKDWLASGKIIIHKNGTANLIIHCAGKQFKAHTRMKRQQDRSGIGL